MRRANSSDSSSVPGSMWLNRRSSENTPARTKLGGSFAGCGGTRSISTTILARLADSEGGGQGGRRPMSKTRRKKRTPKRVLALPDLEPSKAAVLNSLTSKSGQRTYDRAITDFVEWYCSEPRLAFNRSVVLRYRICLEQKQYAPTTINLRLAAVRRVAYEAGIGRHMATRDDPSPGTPVSGPRFGSKSESTIRPSVYRRGQTSSKGNWLRTGKPEAALSNIGFAGCASRASAHWSVSVTHRFLRRGVNLAV